jgi:hypothetical protein
MAQNDEQFIDTLRSLSSAKRLNTAPPVSSDAAKNIQSQLSLRDSTISALQKAPRLGDRAGLIAQGQATDTGGGALGNIGKLLIDNPITKTVLGGLTAVDTPRRFVISTARELVDAVDGDPLTDASFKDLFTQTKDVNYGFGTAFPMEGWGGRVVGFLGDVLLDPITYATLGSSVPAKALIKGTTTPLRAALGAKTLAGAEGRFALARLAKNMGAADDVVKQVAARGRIALPKELAENMGIKRAGVYYFGSRVRVPLSGPVADAIQKGLVRTRLGFFDTTVGEKLGKKFALRGTREQGDTSLARFNLATGKIASGREAAAQIANLGAEDTSRAYQRIAQDTAAKYINPILDDADVVPVKSTVYRLLDNAEDTWATKGIVPTPQEMRAYDKLKAAFKQMHTDVETAFKALDPNFTLNEIKAYLPHIASDDALKLMEDGTSAYGKQIREYLSVNMTDPEGSFRSRNNRVGKEWFGKKLTQEDVDGGVVRLNEIAREATHADGSVNSVPLSFDFFETDMQKIMAKYAGYYSKQVGTAKYMEELFKAGILSSGIDEISISQEAIDAARAAVVARTNARSQSLNEAFKSGKRVTANIKTAFDDLLKKKSPLQTELQRSAQDLEDILPVDVAASNLQSARKELEDTIKSLETNWVNFKNQFDEETAILSMMEQNHLDLVRAHRETLATVDQLIVRYAEDTQKVIDWKKEIPTLQNKLNDIEFEMNKVGKNWENMLEDQERLMNFFDDFASDPYSALTKEGNELLGVLRSVRFGDVPKLEGEKNAFTRWAGESTGDAVRTARSSIDPKGEFGVNDLGRMKYADVREIITTGYTSGSDLRELRKAATWLVARDVILNDGVLPNTPDFLARFEKLQKLVRDAERVDEFVKNSSKVTRVQKGALIDEKDLLVQQKIVDDFQQEEERILNIIDGAYQQAEKEIVREGLSSEQARIVYDKIYKEISPERAIDEFGPLDLVNFINRQKAELQNVRTKINDASKKVSDYYAVKSITEDDVAKTVMSGNYRELAEELSESIAEYHIYSQVQLQFAKMTERASLLGMVPSEQMFNKLVAHIVKDDLELADNFVTSLKQVDDIFENLKADVLQYRGPDMDIYLYDRLSDIFSNPERVAEATLLRDTFPEIEAVWAKHSSNLRSSRALFKDPEGEGIAYTTAQMMQEFGLDPTAGAQTGRRASRGARRVTGKGEYTADNLNAEDVARLRVTSRGSEEAQIAQWDSLAGQVKGNIKKLKEFAGSNRASDAQRKRIVEVVSRYEEAQKRIAKSNKAAKKALAKITGTKGARTNEAALKNIATLGDSYGVSGPLGKALNGGRYDIESFFAELVGGSKFDIRQGTRFSKLQQGKLVRVAPAREEFVNIFENELGKLVDLDGKLVNTAGELVDDAGRRVDRQGRVINSQGQLVDGDGVPIINDKTGFPFQGDGASGGYVYGKKSPIPNQLIQKQDALISRIRQKAQVRRNKLAGVSDDADFIPMDEIRTGSVNSKGDVSWVFADNLYGPRGYANQLELQLSVLDDKIKQADELAKKVKKTEKQAERVVLPRPSAVEAERTAQRSRKALVAAQKLNELESTFFYPRAVERQKFHDFLLRLASMSEDDIENLDFGISAVDEGAVRSGMNLTREEALRVYRIDQQMVESNINRLETELERLNYYARLGNNPNWNAITAIEVKIAGERAEFDRIQGILNLTADAKARPGLPQELRFGFTKREFRSLWVKELTKSEVTSLNNEWIALRKQLASRRLISQRIGLADNVVAENFDKISDITARMAEIDELIATNQARDNAVRKAKFLHTKFEDPAHQGLMNVADRRTVSRQRFTAASGPQGDRNVLGQLQAERAMGSISESEYRQAVGFVGDSSIGTNELIPVTADKALDRLVKGKSKAAGKTIGGRRAFLKEVFDNSEEAKYLQRIADLRLETQSDIGARPQWATRAAELRSQKQSMIKTINRMRGEIDELNISQAVDDINNILTEASAKTGVALPEVTLETARKTGRQAAKTVVKESEASLTRTPLFTVSEELFGSLEAAQNGTLTALQLERRQILKDIKSLRLRSLNAEKRRADAKEAIQALVKLSDRQATILGLPTKTKIKEALDAGRSLRSQMVLVESLGEQTDNAWGKIATETQRLSEAVTKAEVAFDTSTLLRGTAEENMDIVKRQIETVKQMAKKSAKLNKTKKGDAGWVAGLDELLADAEHYMPLIENGMLDEKISASILEYLGKRAVFAQESLALDSAKSELAILKGLKNLTTEELENVRQLRPDAINIKKVFDDGMVQLSEYFPNIGVQKELAEIVQNVHRLQDPAVVRELSKFLSNYTRFFKAYATLSPGFHIRNAMSNGFMLFAAGGNAMRLNEGLKWSRTWTEASKAGKTFDQWILTVPEASRENVKNAFLAAAASGGGMTEEVFAKGALWGTKTSRKVGQRLEQHSRFMLAYDGIASGMDFHTAAARTRRFLIDYENVSSADQVMRQIVPFWMWTSRNLPMQVQNIWLNPRAYQAYGAVKRNLRDDDGDVAVPQWMSEIGAFKLPFGNNLYATPDFGFNRIGAQVQEFKDPTRLLSNLNPLLRLPIELAGGRQLYSNRPFSDTPVEVEGGFSNVLQPLLEALGYGQTGPTGKKFVDDRAFYALRNLLPFLATAERLNPSIPTYQQRGTGNQMLGFIGAPIRQVTGQMQAGERIRRDKELQQATDEQIALEGG